MRAIGFTRAVCCGVFVLVAAPALAQQQATREPGRFQGGLGAVGAGAVGDFSERVDGAGGLLAQMDVRLAKSIFSVGGEWAAIWYGQESRKAYIGNIIPDMPNLTLKVDTEYSMWLLHGRVRAQAASGRLRPYAEGLIGVTNISTTTSINGALSCSGASGTTTCSTDQAAEVTNASDAVLSYGGGAGVLMRFGRAAASASLDLSLRYHHAQEATYLTKGAIVRDGEQATFAFSHSPIDMVMVYVGVSIGR